MAAALERPQARAMRHRVEVQTPPTARDTTGDVVGDWLTLATVWAAIEPLTGAERFASQQRQATTTTAFVVRYLETLTPEKRLVWEGRVFDIESVLGDGRRRWMRVVADERVGEAP